MNIHTIRTKADYRAALQRIDAVWDAKAKSPEADELEVLSLLVEEYEKKHITVPEVDPFSLRLNVMEVTFSYLRHHIYTRNFHEICLATRRRLQ